MVLNTGHIFSVEYDGCVRGLIATATAQVCRLHLIDIQLIAVIASPVRTIRIYGSTAT